MSRMTRAIVLLTGGILLLSAGDALTQPAAGVGAGQTRSAAVSTARGVIKAVSERRLVLDAAPTAGPATLVLDDRTVIERLRKSLTVKDLKVGDAVTVSYTTRDGQPVATRVWVRPARKAATPPSGKTR